ncbi:MAG: HEAT repeat domain-containing protein [Actinobacteria bacterium]|nr:HEAT repeat domain-containing protein [Actinomycetota bacterium]
MGAHSSWGQTPRQSIENESERRGKDAVVAGCIALLEGREADVELIVALGGAPAYWAVSGERGGPRYWLRVWGARGLLWAWDDDALPAITAALNDDSWRVREMAAKVVARHRLGEARPIVADLRQDPTPRVRAAASRALVHLTETGA